MKRVWGLLLWSGAVLAQTQAPKMPVRPDPAMLAKVRVDRYPCDENGQVFVLCGVFDEQRLDTIMAPSNAHEYALGVFKRHAKSDVVRYYFEGLDGHQSFSVNSEGQFEGDGISEHDALLALEASRMEDMDARQADFDRTEAIMAATKADPPPTTIRFGKHVYKVDDVNVFSPYVLGDTTCALRQIRTVNTNPQKRATVLHEAMHVATNCNLDPSLHRAIHQMAPKLLELLRENPALVAYLTSTPAAKP